MRVTELFHDVAKRYPSNIAIYDDAGTMTYGELSNAITAVVKEISQTTISPGTAVGVLGKNSREFIIMSFAVMECGAVLLPMSEQLSVTERASVIDTVQPAAVLSEPGLGENLIPDLIFNTTGYHFTKTADAPHVFNEFVSDPAFIRFTSGTTGTSKGVLLSHTSVIERITHVNNALQLGPDDNVMWVLSMAYHFVVSIILYLCNGCGIIICNDFLSAPMLERINKHKATFLYASPMHIRMLASDAGEAMIESVRMVISTSTGISKDQCELFQKRYNKPVSQAYGIIEIGLPVINSAHAMDVPDAIGYAVKGYDIAILDDNFNRLPPGVTGHLAMRGPGMLDAYLFPPKSRKEILQHDWFMTGDLASMRPDGLIKVEGRMKSMVNVAGNKVFPEEVEAVLNRFPGVKASRVSGYVHALLGEGVKAEIVAKDPTSPPTAEEIRRFCKTKLSSFKVPQQIVFVDTLPMTDSGKIKR